MAYDAELSRPPATDVLPSANAGVMYAEVAVDADEAIVLHQHFQASGPLALDPHHVPGAVARTGAPAGAGMSTP